MQDNDVFKKYGFMAVIAVLIVAAAVYYFYYYFKEKPLEEKGAVETAKDISESVPEIQTNPGEEVPEINPLDRANPFKYTNPLR